MKRQGSRIGNMYAYRNRGDNRCGIGSAGREIFFPEEFRPSHYLVW